MRDYRLTGVFTIFVACVLPAGCTTDLNARSTLGAQRALPALVTDGGDAAPVDDAPTTRLDRAGWEPIEFRLPVDGTAHNPTWLTRPSFDDEPARQYGLYPSVDSVLQLGESSGSRVRAGFAEPARVFVDLLVMPVRVFFDHPWEVEQGPSMYKRWRAGEWLAGPLPDEEAGG